MENRHCHKDYLIPWNGYVNFLMHFKLSWSYEADYEEWKQYWVQSRYLRRKILKYHLMFSKYSLRQDNTWKYSYVWLIFCDIYFEYFYDKWFQVHWKFSSCYAKVLMYHWKFHEFQVLTSMKVIITCSMEIHVI